MSKKMLVLTFSKEDDFVPVELENYHRAPVIENISEVNEDGFLICYWKGSYNKEWTSYTLPACRGDKESQLWTQQLPKSCIICFRFTLDAEYKITVSYKDCRPNRIPVTRSNKIQKINGEKVTLWIRGSTYRTKLLSTLWLTAFLPLSLIFSCRI